MQENSSQLEALVKPIPAAVEQLPVVASPIGSLLGVETQSPSLDLNGESLAARMEAAADPPAPMQLVLTPFHQHNCPFPHTILASRSRKVKLAFLGGSLEA